MTIMSAVMVSIARVNPMAPIRTTSVGGNDDTAEGGAVECDADREPAAMLEPRTHDGCDHHGAHAHPSARQQDIGGVKLPGSFRERQQRGGCGERAYPGEQKAPSPDPNHGVAGERRKNRAEQERQRAGVGDEAGRPAMQALQFGEINRVAVQAETEDEQCHQKARQHHAPAGINKR
jgi:hypothetical protein